MLGDDFLALVGEQGATGECIVVHVREDNCSGGEVTDGESVSSNPLLAVGEYLLEVGAEVGDVLDILGLFFFTEFAAHLVRVQVGNQIGAVVYDVVSLVCLIVISGVVAVLLSEEAEDSAGLVVLLAVLYPDWELAVVEFTGSLAWSELLEGESLVFVLNLSVG